MKTEKFFEIFTELDDELIENALPKKSESKRPAARPVLFRTLAVGTAAAAACVSIAIGVNIYIKRNIWPGSQMTAWGIGEGKMGGEIEFGDTITYPVKSEWRNQFEREIFKEISARAPMPDNPYVVVVGDWKVYQSVEELVEEPEVIVSGKVTDISFASDKGSLCTIYTVDVATPYKGCSDGTLKFVMYNGLRGYKEEEQLKLLPENAQFIPIYENEPEINIGDEYLFILRRFNDSLPTIICPEQTAFPLNVEGDDGYKDRFANASASDIIAYLNG